MVSKTTQRRVSGAGMRGFGLVELLVTMGILVIVLAVVSHIMRRVQQDYQVQREMIQAQENGRIAVDTLVRLIRGAGNDPEDVISLPIVDPDPDGNAQLDSIRIRSDWNPPDGALDDRMEDIIFTTGGGTLFIQEPGDPSPVEYLDGIQSLTFAYYDENSAPITDPIGNPDSIVSVEIQLQTSIPPAAPLLFQSSATIRNRP